MNRRSIKTVLSCIAVALVTPVIGCSGPGHAQQQQQQQQVSNGVAIQADLPYGARPQQDLSVCVPQGGGGPPLPAVIIIHGGGWTHGDKVGGLHWCKMLAMRGFIGVSMNYRLAPGAYWPAQIVDAQLAVRWLRAHARQFNVDPGRICAWGGSSGAHLAVYLAAAQGIVPGDDADKLASVSSRVSCVVDISGPVDLTTPRLERHGETLVGPLDPQTQKARIEDASPLRLVGPHTAPIQVVYGEGDTAVIPQEQSLKLYDVLRQNGVPTELVSYPSDHNLEGLTRDQRAVLEGKIFAFLKRYDR